MKILTLNTHSWMEKKQDDKLNITANTIIEEDFDVVLLQEIKQHLQTKVSSNDGTKIRNDNYAYLLISKLNELSGYEKYFFSCDMFKGPMGDFFEEGIATITKHEIKKSESIQLTKNIKESNWKFRKALYTEIEIDNTIYGFLNAHLGHFDDMQASFSYQLKGLKEILNPDLINIIGGDFNVVYKEIGYTFLRDYTGFYDLHELYENQNNLSDEIFTIPGDIAGWKNDHGKKRIDYIFSNKDLDVEKSVVIFNDKNKPLVSDHYGYFVKINVT